MNRFEKADIIVGGASNPRKVAMSLVEAIDEARAEGADDATIKDDPAVVLILDHLAQLLGTPLFHAPGYAERFAAAYSATMIKLNKD